MMMSSSLFKDAKRRRFRRLLWTKKGGSGAHLLDLRRSSGRSGVGVDVGGAGVEKKVRQFREKYPCVDSQEKRSQYLMLYCA